MSQSELVASSFPLFSKAAIIGLGLIGASLAQAIKDNGLAKQIVAVDRHPPSLEAAIADGLISAGSPSLKEVINGCDLIVMAIPVQAVAAVLAQIAAAMESGLIERDCVISDVCSTKLSVLQAARQVFFDQLPVGLVPAHPIAGAENSGYHARRGDLFVNHNVIICPPSLSAIEGLAASPAPSPSSISSPAAVNAVAEDPQRHIDKLAAVDKVTALWELVGAEVISMSAEHHDKVLAHTSHLPHLLAFNLVAQLADHDDNMDIFRYAAGGFRDFTRIAASDPLMWHDIFLANQDAIVSALDEYSEYLKQLRGLIVDQDSVAILGLLGRAQAARRHFGHMLSSTPYTQSSPKSLAYVITPTEQVSGVISVPGDKSISHRSIMLGSLATGITRVSGFLEGEDALATLQAFRDMGVTIEGPEQGQVIIHGVGMHGLKPSKTPLYMGNSGTSMRLLAGILAAQDFDSVLTGDVSLSKRPMERVAAPLRQMGAQIQSTGHSGTAPLSITGRAKVGQPLHGIDYHLPVASAQIKSCLLLAGLWATGTTTVIQPTPSRDHTERMLKGFGYPINVEDHQISLKGGGELVGCDIIVPADISSAAFFMVAASIARDSQITLPKVGVNPTRTGVIDILKQMGADITLSNEAMVGGEPVADISIASAQLRGIDIPEHLVPLAIDEFPVLFIAASCAIGPTRLTGAKELRVKESDRIAAMAEGLQTLGVPCQITDDGIIIQGVTEQAAEQHAAVFKGGKLWSHRDHRIAMSFAIASLRAEDTIIIEGVESVNTSFPDFSNLANQLGLSIAIKSA